MLDFDERPKVWLVSSDRTQVGYPTMTQLYLRLIIVKGNTDSSGVAIRWITPSRALNHPTISSIPIDDATVSRDTTIADLKLIAKQRTFFAPYTSEAPYSPLMNVALYLGICGLVTTDAATTTLSDVIDGKIPNPLDIYVVPVKEDFANAESPQGVWAFDYSKRGLATFLTCLKALIE